MEGATVVASDVSVVRLEDLVAEHPDLDLVTVAGDISTEDTVQAVVAAAGGRVDALANVAGIMDAFLPPAEVDHATGDRVFAVNVTAVMRLTRAVLPLMLEAGIGAIVNVSSEASLRASASASGVAYTASKHAVNGLTKSTAGFYKSQGIRANAVAPRGGPDEHRSTVQVRARRCRPRADHGHDHPGARDFRAARGNDHVAAQRRREQRQRRHPPVRRRLVGHLSGGSPPRRSCSALRPPPSRVRVAQPCDRLRVPYELLSPATSEPHTSSEVSCSTRSKPAHLLLHLPQNGGSSGSSTLGRASIRGRGSTVGSAG